MRPEELELIKELEEFPAVAVGAAAALEPTASTGYLEGLARIAHGWYHKYRVLGEPEEAARLVLARAVRQVLANGLTSWGSTPRNGCNVGLLVVGSIGSTRDYALRRNRRCARRAAVFFSMAGAVLHPVQVVGVRGQRFSRGASHRPRARGVEPGRRRAAAGRVVPLEGAHSYDLASRETLDTRLGVFAQFRPRIPEKFRAARFVFPRQHDPELQLGVLDQVKQPDGSSPATR